MDGMTAVTWGMTDRKAVGPDSLPVQILKIDHPEFTRCFHNLLSTVWRTGDAPQQMKEATIRPFMKTRIALVATTTERFFLMLFQVKYCLK